MIFVAVVANYTYDAWGRLLSVKNASGSTISDASHIANVNPIRYRGYFYDTETKLYYCNSRYYDPQVKRFINADEYLSTGQGFNGFNMFAYCNNNPVMYYDPSGEIGLIVGILVGIAVGSLVVSIPSSEKIEPTESQIKEAESAANRAEYVVRSDSDGNPYTVDINIDTKDVIDSVDNIAMDYYYESLYERSVEIADEAGVPADNLMSSVHIAWEFEFHLAAYYVGIENARTTNLNVEETIFSMIKRLF